MILDEPVLSFIKHSQVLKPNLVITEEVNTSHKAVKPLIRIARMVTIQFLAYALDLNWGP